MVVVITGASKGIGRAIAEKLAEDGHLLALCARTESELILLRDQILKRTSCPGIVIRALDVRNRSSLSEFANHVLEEFGHIDVLINNAGIFVPGKIVDETSGTYDMVLETNLHSAYFLTKSILPTMLKRKSGHIINICSVASIQAYPNGGSYAISKHALHGFGKTLREEVRSQGIRVTNILPGATWTDSWAGVDLPDDRLMGVHNVAQVVATAINLDDNAMVEEIIIRPIKGDLPMN